MGKHKLWITTFEFGPEKLGGLGEVPTNQVKHLQGDIDITVLMPAHGSIHGTTARKVQSKKLDYDLEFLQRFKGINDDPKNKFLDNYPDEARVKISPHELILPGTTARVVVFSGNDPLTQKILDDPVIYSMEGLRSKIAVFSRALKQFMDHEAARDNLPDVIHIHDYHAVPGIIGCRQVLLGRGLDVATIFTVHLLTWPKVTMDYLNCCGVENIEMPFTINGKRVKITVSNLVNIAKNRLEFMSAFMSDLVTSVSKSYLIENVIPNCGAELLDGKTDFIHNGCDWNHDEIIKSVNESVRMELANFLGKKADKKASHTDLRRFLATWKLGHLQAGEPVIEDPVLMQAIKKYDGVAPFIENGRITSFPVDGKLCLLTGRASKQKGIELVFDAIPEIIDKYPSINFLFTCLPTQGEKNLIGEYCNRATDERVRDHVRFNWGKAASIFNLAHVAADMYLAPSRWEPFGIMVLEAHAMGLPVIGARVGGIKETVIDVGKNPVEGTGILFEKEDTKALGQAVVDMAHTIDASETKDPALQADAINAITDPVLNDIVKKNPSLYLTMCSNARHRVETHFRWSHVARKELDLLQNSMQIRKKREE